MGALSALVQQSGLAALSWQNVVMYAVGGTLVFLAIRKGYEPLLLIPIGFGAILANLPLAAMSAGSASTAGSGYSPDGLLQHVYDSGIATQVLPPLIFLGVGSLTDFRPLLARPMTFLLGAAAQFGIFVAAVGAVYLFGFSPHEAASIGIIGGADGPTTIFVASRLAPDLLGSVAVAAYSYMSLVPIIQPPVIRLLTTQAEREIEIPPPLAVSRTAVIVFPVVTALLAALFIPATAPLLGMLMFGNLLREAGVTDRLSKTAGGALIDVTTIFLGLTVGATMAGDSFIKPKTLGILLLGAVAFVFGTAGGVLLAKALNLLLPQGSKINPCIGAAGVSAVPMSARVVQRFVAESTGGRVNPLMAAMGPNVAGVIGSAVVAGVFLALLG